MLLLHEEEEKEDVVLEDMGHALGRLQYQDVVVQDEIQDQNRVLDDTTQQVADTQDKLDLTNTRQKRLRSKLARCCETAHICCLIVLWCAVIVIILLIAIE